MARAPFNVLVFPYIKTGDNKLEYALLKRSDTGFWLGAAGGGEDDETPLDAAKREAFEETGIPMSSQFIQLDTVNSYPVTYSTANDLWGANVYVIPEYAFGVQANNRRIILSEEHIEYKWLEYEQAYDMVRYEGDRIALWELDRKLRGLGPTD
jgi:dATP pyrophosphohydrolase